MPKELIAAIRLASCIDAHRLSIFARRAFQETFGAQNSPEELLPVTNYLPDVAVIAKSRVKVCMAAGNRSLDKRRFYADTARKLSERLRCEMVTLPGHHGSFVDMPDQWAATLRDALHRAAANE